MLKNLDGEIDNNDMPSDEEDCEENPELLADLERKQEEYIEEFMERTFDVKAEYLDQVKAQCKTLGIKGADLKAKTQEAEKKIKEIRRTGTKELKQMFTEIIEDDERTLPMKVSFFHENAQEIRDKMDELLKIELDF